MTITNCNRCGERLSGGVNTQAGLLRAYFIGIADTEDGIQVGRVTWPISANAECGITFENIGALKYCPFCGNNLSNNDRQQRIPRGGKNIDIIADFVLSGDDRLEIPSETMEETLRLESGLHVAARRRFNGLVKVSRVGKTMVLTKGDANEQD